MNPQNNFVNQLTPSILPPEQIKTPFISPEEASAPLANLMMPTPAPNTFNLQDGLQQASQNLSQSIQQASQGIQQASQGLGNGFIQASQGLANNVQQASQGLGNNIIQASNNISNGLNSASQNIMATPKEIIDNISETFTIPKETATSLSESSSFGSSDGFDFSTIFTAFLLLGLVALVIVYGFQYFYNIDMIAKIKNIFSNHPEVEIKVEKQTETVPDLEKKDAIDNDVGQILKRPQVFNIPENNYIYDDAKAICQAYGARLATYEEVEEAYNKGAEWCNYGWSDDQMILFPTQQKTWEKLQTIEGHKNDCGRPGINGGYMENKMGKYGVNCYGYKPRINKTEKEMMDNNTIYPKTKEDQAIEKRVEYWKNNLSTILVSPFNHDKWSKI